MCSDPIRFDDGEAYEQGMGVWSRQVGAVFLDWLDASPGLRWADIGCGNGAFTELLIQRTAPAAVKAIDPSEGQLAFARTRPGAAGAIFQQGDAMALPFATAEFDAAVMALVLFFVPQPARGIAEMMRVTRPGGLVSAYVWDVPAGGLPIEPVRYGLRAIGIEPASPPSAAVSAMEALRQAWLDAGLTGVATRAIPVERRFPHFDAYWTAAMGVGSLGERMATLEPAAVQETKARTRTALEIDSTGAVLARGLANAVKGITPASP